MFTTEARIKDRLASLLKFSGGAAEIDDIYDNIIVDARTAAYNEIVGSLATRGYSPTQIDAWDRGAEFETDLALWFCLVKMAGTIGADDRFIARLDRRPDLMGDPSRGISPVPITVGGQLVNPGGTDRIKIGDTSDDYGQFKYRVASDGTVTKSEW